ncbi:MAG: hypothetical protein RIR18_918 [Pseudomonadota bacterium]|jgi:hypothetical protein
MTAITFDTHEIIKELQAGGVEPRQAEAIVSAFKKTQESAELASKKDLMDMKAELKTEMASNKLDLLKWAFAMLAGQTALILTILPKLIH